jgi:hypothetical protein
MHCDAYNLLISGILGIVLALFSFLAPRTPLFADEGGAVSLRGDLQGSLVVGFLYFVAVFAILTLVRVVIPLRIKRQ